MNMNFEFVRIGCCIERVLFGQHSPHTSYIRLVMAQREQLFLFVNSQHRRMRAPTFVEFSQGLLRQLFVHQSVAVDIIECDHGFAA